MRGVCVCVPARNEADRLPILLDALACQSIEGSLRVALCVNNSDDGSALVARGWALASGCALDLSVIERRFAPHLAHAGSARKAAMDRGADLLGDDAAVLISTDADCRPPPTWVEAILDALGADDLIVGGRIVLDESETLDPAMRALHRRWDSYWAAVRAIEDAIDPIDWDLPPRHGDHTGASLALTVGLYRKAGGAPPLATGEDRALVDAAIAVGGRLVHPPSVWTRTSARTQGRAQGGMAEVMRQLATCAGDATAPLVPDFEHWAARADWRKTARQSCPADEIVRQERSLPPMPCDMRLPEFA